MPGDKLSGGEAAWLRSPVSEKAQRLQPMQELLLTPYQGRSRQVKVFRTRIVLGSAEGCDLRIDDPFVSPRHAELRIEAAGEGYSVHDLGSRNGVFVNGVRVGSAPLPRHGTLRLGRSTLSWSDAPSGAELLEGGWVVADPAMQALMAGLRRIALSSLPVLMLGETGTGKDMLAQLLHRWGPGKGPFVPVNGALTGGALAESELFGHRKGAFTGAESARLGALRSAHGGTLFLDEVADIPLATQVKLLRALEAGEVKALGSDLAERAEFRVVTATSRDLERRIGEGAFRADLYYRIAGFVLHVPPLRERPLDILAIARHLGGGHGLDLDEEAAARLLSYSWPGNVRELRSCMGRAAVLARSEGAGRILSHHLAGLEGPAPVPPERENGGVSMEELERRGVQRALERHGWMRTAAARELGIARSTLLKKMKRFGLRDGSAVTEPPGSG